MSDATFTHDVFLSHSAKDKAMVRALAERLRADGLRVWLDEWEIRPGDSIPAKIEEGLEQSRVLVLCMSAHAFGSDWAALEAGTFRFRDPLNKDRRFIPLRLDDAPIKGSLAQFLYIKWLPAAREQEYPRLLERCRPPTKAPMTFDQPSVKLANSEEIERPAETDDEKKRAAERRWQYIQNHPIRGVKILLVLKGAVGFEWFRELLEDTRLTFSRDEPSFKLGQLLAASPAPNTKEPSRTMEQPVCSFWEIYQPEDGYWFKKIAPTPREFSKVAGFDAVTPWPVLGVTGVGKLQDLAMLTDIGVSIPARAYQVGVEESEVGFLGDTFSFAVRLSEHGLEFLHEMSRVQHTVVKGGKPTPIGSHFSGVQLLEMFFCQLLPRPDNARSKSRAGITGMSGPGGRAISFYPAMPIGFTKSPESNEYTFKITVPAKVDSAARIEELEAKLKSTPTDTRAYGELAALYSQEGRLQDAMKCLEAGFEKAPPTAEVHGLMAQFLGEVGRHDEALAHLKRAEVLAPKNTMVQTNLGVCLNALGRDDEALAHFRAAAHIEPSSADYQFNLSLALAGVKRYSEALAPAKRAVDLAPESATAAMRLGVLLEIEGRNTEATPFLQRAAELSPDDADAQELCGQHLANLGDHERAVVHLQRALDIEENARRCNLLGASLADLDRWAEAETVFRRGIGLQPKDSALVAMENLGAAIANLGRWAEAAEVYEGLLQANPNSVSARQNLALLRNMQEESSIVLDTESKERVLVGEVISTVALAGQICREFNVSDQGIDMEIEFTDDAHEATGAKVYLQLKSGDSYLRERKSDGAEIFTIKDERHARYWMAQAFPVLLVIRNSEGEVRWMEVRDWLKRESNDGRKPVKQIVFAGERFDVMSVRRWRDRALGRGLP